MVEFAIKAGGRLVIKVFDVRGELVKNIIDGTNDQGHDVSSGVV